MVKPHARWISFAFCTLVMAPGAGPLAAQGHDRVTALGWGASVSTDRIFIEFGSIPVSGGWATVVQLGRYSAQQAFGAGADRLGFVDGTRPILASMLIGGRFPLRWLPPGDLGLRLATGATSYWGQAFSAGPGPAIIPEVGPRIGLDAEIGLGFYPAAGGFWSEFRMRASTVYGVGFRGFAPSVAVGIAF